ncbi:hypothetical protein [uncultured Microbacterium sp.]|uniref:Uncharacterized protein n=1 Tax=uncultured Microbacterium sp. TaxID=191216 RepID=A0A1Y5P5U7_9MICO|nr:hypothetical protein [uncultured Microbacterium sp.]SBS72900.1 conserved exported hypothetical protein [uncultured Microbacterium sp.]
MTGPHSTPARQRRDRTPIVLGIVAGVLAVVVGVTLTIALTRDGSPETAPSPRPPAQTTAPDGTPSAEPTAPDEEPAGVQLSATGFALVDDTGAETFAYRWSDPSEPAVAALTAAFGAAPEQRTEKGDGSHYPDYTVHQWPGFALYDMVVSEGGSDRDTYAQPSWIRVTANTIGEVAVTAEFGIQIGTTVDAVEAAGPDTDFERNGALRYVFAADRSSTAEETPSYSMMADTDGDAVTAILYYFYADL